MESRTFTIEEALKHGWGAFMQRPLFWIGVQFTLLFVQFILDAVGGFFAPDGESASLFGGLIAFVISIIAIGVWVRLTLGYTHMALMAIEGREPVFADLLAEKELFWRFLGASLLFSLAISIGMALLVLPALYILVRFGFFGFGMVDRGTAIWDSFSVSSRITEGYRWQLAGLALLLLVINILAMIPFLLGLLVSLPFTMLTAAFVYRRLSEAAPAEATL